MENNQKRDEQTEITPQRDNILMELSELANSETNINEQKKRTKGLRGKKKLMIQALINSLGVVNEACNQVGIGRTTHYDWMRDDPIYAKATIEADENYKDLIQKTIAKVGLIDKQPNILLHLAKTKLRDRGYGEKLEITGELKIDKSLDKLKEAIKDIPPEYAEKILLSL